MGMGLGKSAALDKKHFYAHQHYGCEEKENGEQECTHGRAFVFLQCKYRKENAIFFLI